MNSVAHKLNRIPVTLLFSVPIEWPVGCYFYPERIVGVLCPRGLLSVGRFIDEDEKPAQAPFCTLGAGIICCVGRSSSNGSDLG